MEKVALFDFCGTIANYQTLNPFLEYVLRRERPIRHRLICNAPVRRMLLLMEGAAMRIGYKHYLYKELLVRNMKGISRQKLEQYGAGYYQVQVRKNLVCSTVDLIKELQEKGRRIVIVSAGSAFYIECFAKEYHVNDVITAEFDFTESGICTGRLRSECMGSEKLERIQTYMKTAVTQGVYDIGCSDSRSDLPMLDLCQRRIVVSHGEHQAWVADDMEEIIWR